VKKKTLIEKIRNYLDTSGMCYCYRCGCYYDDERRAKSLARFVQKIIKEQKNEKNNSRNSR